MSSTTMRRYASQDANFNVAALVSSTGTVVERYSYAAYGKRTVMRPNVVVVGFSLYGMTIGHQGLRHDASGLVFNRARCLHSGLRRLRQEDQLGYVDEANCYIYKLLANHLSR